MRRRLHSDLASTPQTCFPITPDSNPPAQMIVIGARWRLEHHSQLFLSITPDRPAVALSLIQMPSPQHKDNEPVSKAYRYTTAAPAKLIVRGF